MKVTGRNSMCYLAAFGSQFGLFGDLNFHFHDVYIVYSQQKVMEYMQTFLL